MCFEGTRSVRTFINYIHYLNSVVAAHSLVVVFRIYDVYVMGTSPKMTSVRYVKSNVWSVPHSGASVLFEVFL